MLQAQKRTWEERGLEEVDQGTEQPALKRLHREFDSNDSLQVLYQGRY